MTVSVTEAETIELPVIRTVSWPQRWRGWQADHATGLALGVACGADGVGVLLLAAADARSRSGASGGYLLFWVGLAFIFLPSAAVLMLSRRSRDARLAVAMAFGLALYMAKVVYEPTAFTFHDEFAHYRNASNLLASGQLFGYNPLIRATGYYPGLAVVTDALVRLTGLSVYTCGLILLGCARLTLVGALFLLADKLLKSPRAAGTTVLVYAANPNFLYWDLQYAYESLALPLAFLAVLYLARRNGRSPTVPAALCAMVAALAVVVTHHVTAWALTVLLVAWTGAAWWWRRRHFPAAADYVPRLPTAVTGSATVLWLVALAPITVGYLGPVLSRATVQGIQLITQHQTSRTLFQNPGQTVTAPFWEEAAAIGATLTILAILPQALDRIKGTNLSLIAKLLAVSSLLWVVVLPLRFTVYGQETANRSSEFAYLGIGLCVAFLLESFLDSSAWRRVSALAIVVLLFVGGIAVSVNYSERLAPDYRLANGSTVVTPDDQTLARWMLSALGPGHRIATDAMTGLALGSVGRQDVLSSAENNARVWDIFYPRTVNAQVLTEIHRSRVQYVVVQSDVLDFPVGVTRFDDDEPWQDYDAPLPTASLAKFNRSPLFHEIYAAGSLHVYQVAGSARGG